MDKCITCRGILVILCNHLIYPSKVGLMCCLYLWPHSLSCPLIDIRSSSPQYSRTSFNKLPEYTKILVPFGPVNTFFTSERRKPLYYSKNGQKFWVPKCPKFHCNIRNGKRKVKNGKFSVILEAMYKCGIYWEY